MENENTTLKSCSDAERWAWQEIMAGRPADFDHRYGTQLDRKKKDDWDNPERSRAISQGFIEYILTHTSPTTQPLGYIIIKGAWFPKALTCAVRKINAPLWFDGCRFEDGVDFSSCEFENIIAFRCCFISGALTLERSYFKKTFRLEWVYIMGEVILSGARAASDVFIDGSEIHGVLTLVTAHVAGVLSLRTSTVHGSVDARLVSVDTLLTMDNAIFSTDVAFTEADVKSISICHDGHPPTFLGIFSLRGAHISRELRVRGSRFKGLVNLNNVEVGGALVITSSMLGQTYLNGARVGSHLHINGHFEGQIVSISTSVHSDVHISGKGMSQIDFTDVTINRRLLMEGDFDGPVAASHVSCSALTMRASFKRQVNIDSCNMSQHLMVTGSTFGDTVNIVACDIAGGLAISGARFSKTVDMGGTRIAGELRLGSEVHAAAEWADDAELILRDARAGVLQDRLDRDRVEGVASDAWPRKLQITNFTYERLGGMYGGGESDMQRRDVRWYSNWLNRDQSYSPQPYEHLARVIRDTGDREKANAILYAGRERARKEARKRRQFGRWSGLTMLNLTMGYGLGYRYFRVVWWLIAITLVGALVLAKSMPPDKLAIPVWLTSAPIAVVASPPESALLRYNLSDLLFASLDQLLPIVELDKSHDRLFSADMLPRWSRYWFYVQSIFGYLLGSFLVAGLAGLTQKN